MISADDDWLIDVMPEPQPENLVAISDEELREYLRCNEKFAEDESIKPPHQQDGDVG